MEDCKTGLFNQEGGQAIILGHHQVAWRHYRKNFQIGGLLVLVHIDGLDIVGLVPARKMGQASASTMIRIKSSFLSF